MQVFFINKKSLNHLSIRVFVHGRSLHTCNVGDSRAYFDRARQDPAGER